MKIGILNGPNLNLIGQREPNIYGKHSFESFLNKLCQKYEHIDIEYYQSNHEGDLIDTVQKWGYSKAGVIINGAGYTHTSIALADAIKSVNAPFLEVHISNIYAREDYRHRSYLSAACVGGLFGLGLFGYDLGVQYFEDLFNPH